MTRTNQIALVIYMTMMGQLAHAQTPSLPSPKDFDAAAAKQRSDQALDDAEKAARRGPIRMMPDIKTPASGVDISEIVSRYNQRHNQVQAQESNLLIFVTFGMPQVALARLAKQAAQAGAVMVFRGLDGGLARGNLVRSFEAFKPLAEAGASIQIHPELFKAYNVTHAPTFILAAPDQTDACMSDRTKACANVLRSVGDVSLDYVLERWASGTGDLAMEARRRLAKVEAQ